jgi:putative transposase
MKQKRYTDEQIAFALRQAESGTAVAEICRKLGVSEPTFYRWKKQFAGMGTVEIRRLKQLEEENAKLKRWSLTSASTKPCCRMCCEKSGEARAAPRRGGCAARQLPGQRASGLLGDGVSPFSAALPVSA